SGPSRDPSRTSLLQARLDPRMVEPQELRAWRCRDRALLHIGRDIALDCPEFRIRERQLPKSGPMLAWGVSGDCAVRAVQDAVEAKLAKAGRDQLAFLLPLADPSYSRKVKEDVRHSPVVLRKRVCEHAESLVDGRVIVAAGARKMRDLYRNARR